MTIRERRWLKLLCSLTFVRQCQFGAMAELSDVRRASESRWQA